MISLKSSDPRQTIMLALTILVNPGILRVSTHKSTELCSNIKLYAHDYVSHWMDDVSSFKKDFKTYLSKFFVDNKKTSGRTLVLVLQYIVKYILIFYNLVNIYIVVSSYYYSCKPT